MRDPSYSIGLQVQEGQGIQEGEQERGIEVSLRLPSQPPFAASVASSPHLWSREEERESARDRGGTHVAKRSEGRRTGASVPRVRDPCCHSCLRLPSSSLVPAASSGSSREPSHAGSLLSTVTSVSQAVKSVLATVLTSHVSVAVCRVCLTQRGRRWTRQQEAEQQRRRSERDKSRRESDDASERVACTLLSGSFPPLLPLSLSLTHSSHSCSRLIECPSSRSFDPVRESSRRPAWSA